jgi:external thioesterase TEII
MIRLFQHLSASSTNIQLICFPFAGGYSASFRPLQPLLQDHCDLFVAEPPGHGSNQMLLVENLEKLVDMYLEALIPQLGKPLVLFGHSMGGLVVYRLAQQLEQRGIFPEAVIISSVQPPHIRRNPISHLSDGDFLHHVIGLGGVPPELVEAREVLDYFLPAFRADFKALETFEHKDMYMLESAVHIFNGEEDDLCMKDSEGWKQWARRIVFHTFRGGHMFLLSETEKLAQAILSILDADINQKAVAQR